MGFDPASLAIAGLASSALGAGVSAVGALSSAEAQSRSAAYSAQVARNNATVANQNAEHATQVGQEEAAAQGAKNRAALGAVAAGEAANGVDVNSGSAAETQETQREEGQLDTLTTVNNAALQAYGYRTQSVNYGAQSALDTATAQQAPTAGALAAGGDLLSGASSVGVNWAKFQNAGAVGS